MFELNELIVGDTYCWSFSNDNYKSGDGWTLTYYFNGAVTGSLIGTKSADNISFGITASSAFTSQFPSGSYSVIAIVSKASERYTVEETSVEFLADPTTVGLGYDPRSHVHKVFDALKAVIEGRATEREMAMTINGRSISKIPMKELLSMYYEYKLMYQRELQAERIAKGLQAGNQVVVRFQPN